MVFLRFLGCVVLSFSGLFCGNFFAEKIKRRKNHLEQMIFSTEHLLKRMDYTREELSTVLPLCYGKCDFLEINGKSVSVKKCDLNEVDTDIIKEFFEGLGREDMESEKKKCKLYLQILNERLQNSKEECNKKCRVFKVSGFCIGLLAGIVIL